MTRLEVFGSAARGGDFDPARSDIDLLVEMAPPTTNYMTRLLDLQEALTVLLGRPVDLVDRRAVETSRNHIRRKNILEGAEALYAA